MQIFKPVLKILLAILILSSADLSAQIKIEGEDFLANTGLSLYTGLMVKLEDGTVITRFASIYTNHDKILEDIEKKYGKAVDGLWAGEIETVKNNLGQTIITKINTFAGIIKRRPSLFKNASAQNLYNLLLEQEQTRQLVETKPTIEDYTDQNVSIKPSTEITMLLRHSFKGAMAELSNYITAMKEGKIKEAQKSLNLAKGSFTEAITAYYANEKTTFKAMGAADINFQIMMDLIAKDILAYNSLSLDGWEKVKELYEESTSKYYEVSIKPEPIVKPELITTPEKPFVKPTVVDEANELSIKVRHHFFGAINSISDYVKYMEEGKTTEAVQSLSLIKSENSDLINIYLIYPDLLSFWSGLYGSALDNMMKLIEEGIFGDKKLALKKWKEVLAYYQKGTGNKKLEELGAIEREYPISYDKIIAMNESTLFAPEDGTIVYIGSGGNYLEWMLAAIVNKQRGFNRKIIASDPYIGISVENIYCNAECFANPVERKEILKKVWSYLSEKNDLAKRKNTSLIQHNEPPSEYELLTKLHNISSEDFMSALDNKSVILTTEVVNQSFVGKYGQADAVVSFAQNVYDPLFLAEGANLIKPNGVLWASTDAGRHKNSTKFASSFRTRSEKELRIDKHATEYIHKDAFSSYWNNAILYVNSNTSTIAITVTNRPLDDILLNGFSDDKQKRIEEITFLLNYFENTTDENTKTLIVSTLSQLNPYEATNLQQQKIVAIKNNLAKNSPHYLIATETAFNEDMFISNARKYLNLYSDKKISAKEFASVGIRKLVGRLNKWWKSKAPMGEMLSEKDLPFLVGPNSVMNFLVNRINNIPEGNQKDANILGLYSLVEIIKTVPDSRWKTVSYIDRKWSENLEFKIDKLVKEKMETNLKFRQLVKSCTKKNDGGFDALKGLEILRGK